MERPSNGLNVELAGIADVLKDCKRGKDGFQPAAYATEANSQTARRRGQDTRVAALEFCVHGIVVHLRLGLFANPFR